MKRYFAIATILFLAFLVTVSSCATGSNSGSMAANPRATIRNAFQFTIDTDIEPRRLQNPKQVEIAISTTQFPKKCSSWFEVKNMRCQNKEVHEADYDLDCDGDGKFEKTGLTESSSCVFEPGTGKHQISIRGKLPVIWLCDRSHEQKMFRKKNGRNAKYVPDDASLVVVSVDNWGGMEWKSMLAFAAECKNLELIPVDAPDLSDVMELGYAFAGATKFNQPVEHWDVSNVSIMAWMFSDTAFFNQPLERWNVSNVKDFDGMFSHAQKFNQPLNGWNPASAKTMHSMFKNASSFDQPLDNWDVSNARTSRMFEGASEFSHYPENWVLKDNDDYNYMFDRTKVESLARQKPLRTK